MMLLAKNKLILKKCLGAIWKQLLQRNQINLSEVFDLTTRRSASKRSALLKFYIMSSA